ncbi:MAG: ATP-binding cassette domain-containing protein [Candidatus Omnitrophica bacterium]|nr:ATP-binding cassette domain-containing protein [Candidatus Omnitrophota bacterium]MCA9447164.1 ATP-binding cassette domain-containing protein [Candidatus Omnitrophota bacterium]
MSNAFAGQGAGENARGAGRVLNIHLSSIRVQFEGMKKPLLQIDDQRAPSGSHLLIRGPSGAGKTTLLHLLAGLLDPQEGAIDIGGNPLHRLSENEKCAWRRNHVGLVFQKLNLLGHLTALENVLLGSPGKGLNREKATAALERLGVHHLADKLAYQLSLGEQQRVAVARVVARKPPLILADEPTSSLDEANAGLVMDVLFETKGHEGTLIVATHDDRVAGRFEKTWRLANGVIR